MKDLISEKLDMMKKENIILYFRKNELGLAFYFSVAAHSFGYYLSNVSV